MQDRPGVPRQISQGNRITGGKPKQCYLQATPTPFSVTGVRKTQLGRRQLGLQGPAPPRRGDSTWGWKGGCWDPEHSASRGICEDK